jgi:uncharacterized protein (TIGR00251 family)
MAAPGADWLSRRDDGVRLSVKVTPRASRGGIQGIEVDGSGQAYLVVRVAAPPEGGKANAATIKLLARHCGVAAGALRLVSGAAGRRKVVDVHGEAGQLVERLRALADQTESKR